MNLEKAVTTNQAELYQQRRNCIERLPTCLFQVVLLFSTEKDYRNFMNLHLSIFRSLKNETIILFPLIQKIYSKTNVSFLVC
jgi:hypothetical protein